MPASARTWAAASRAPSFFALPEAVSGFLAFRRPFGSVAVGVWDDDKPPLELAQLQQMNFDLNLTGFSADELMRLLGSGQNEGLTDPIGLLTTPSIDWDWVDRRSSGAGGGLGAHPDRRRAGPRRKCLSVCRSSKDEDPVRHPRGRLSFPYG